MRKHIRECIDLFETEGLDINDINTKGKHLKFFVTGGYITISSTPSSRFWRHKTRSIIRRYMNNF